MMFDPQRLADLVFQPPPPARGGDAASSAVVAVSR